MRVRIAFDIDDTLFKVVYEPRQIFDGSIELLPTRQIPDYEMITMLTTLHKLGRVEIFCWSGGGMEYCMRICDLLGIRNMVQIIPKDMESSKAYGIDLTFDDKMVELGKVNIQIRREKDVL